VVGHVAVHRAAASTAEVSRLFVAPAARGNNVAAELLRSARQWATVHRLRLVLEIVDGPRSAAAIAVYERTGWQHTRTTTADWTTPDGQPVRLRRYTLASEASSKMP
jgi:GNAT superfamily N-acetyltransferase